MRFRCMLPGGEGDSLQLVDPNCVIGDGGGVGGKESGRSYIAVKERRWGEI